MSDTRTEIDRELLEAMMASLEREGTEPPPRFIVSGRDPYVPVCDDQEEELAE